MRLRYSAYCFIIAHFSHFFGQPFVKQIALCYQTVVLSVCDVGVLWPNGWTNQDETWHAGRPSPRPHCVRWRPSFPQKWGTAIPVFGPCLLWPNGWIH